MLSNILKWSKIDVYKLLTKVEYLLRLPTVRLCIPIEIICKSRAIGVVLL